MPAYSRVTLTQLKARLTEKVGNNTTFWTDAEKKDAINEALSIWQITTGAFVKIFSIPVVAGTTFYQVPKQIASTNRVLWNGTSLALISLWELDLGFVGWQTAVGTPQYWSPTGIDKFALYPQPTSGSIRLEGYMEGFRLQADGDFLQLGDEELTRLLEYAHHYLTIKENISEMSATREGLKRFFTAATLKNARLAATAFYRRLMGQMRDEKEREPRSPFGSGGLRG